MTQTMPGHTLLQQVYDLYDEFINDLHDLNKACTKGCAACCTRNVTVTSLEADLMIRHLNAEGPDQWLRIAAAANQTRFQPKITINQLADLCAADQPLPEEEMDPDPGPCPLLKEDICMVYSVRPFGCRAMISNAVCSAENAAMMPELVLTVNNMFLQFLETADSRGVFGNLIDVLLYLHNGKDCDPTDIRRIIRNRSQQLIANRPMSVLMIPPEHRRPVAPLLERLRGILISAKIS